ncbi:MAG: hypothetical protein IT423_11720 [Pirellulaceae bacterium]|nr:hypothetical protein [Pirellulaceae bacterium]
MREGKETWATYEFDAIVDAPYDVILKRFPKNTSAGSVEANWVDGEFIVSDNDINKGGGEVVFVDDVF